MITSVANSSVMQKWSNVGLDKKIKISVSNRWTYAGRSTRRSRSQSCIVQSRIFQLRWSDRICSVLYNLEVRQTIIHSITLPIDVNSWHTLERVSIYKLLGVFISADLRWETHIEYIISKAASRLYFLKQLKRAGLSSSHLLHFYTTVIRPVLEYASPLWHPNLTKSQTERPKAIQRRDNALKIIFVIPHPPRILLL